VAALIVAYAVLAYADRSASPHVYGYLGVIPLDCLAFATIGALVASRLPRNPIGWLFLAIGLILMITSDAQLYAIRGVIASPGSLPFAEVAGWLGSWFWGPGVGLAVVMVPLLFPDGKPPARWGWWTRAAAVVLVVQALVGAVASIPAPHTRLDPSGQFNPMQNGGLQVVVFTIAYVAFLPIAAGSFASLFARRRRADGVQRQQLKFFLLAGLVVFLGLVCSGVGNTLGGGAGTLYDVSASIFVTSVAAMPIGAGLAILRYRLYDIDLVISRTLVYGAMAALITAVYVGIVVGVGSLVGSAGRNNLLLSIIATAVVALAFQPLRSRLQTVANHLVYGRRATPYEVLSAFTDGIGETFTDWNVVARMAQLVGEATDATRVEVWARVADRLQPAAAWPGGIESDAVDVQGQLLPALPARIAVPIRHAGELLGAITVTKRTAAELTPLEAKLVDDLARQAGLVLRNAGLTVSLEQRLEELRASRQRLVAAQDLERRRIERNLHDGAQQHLVALKVQIGLLETMLRKDPDKALAVVEQVKAGADEALETLRDLARGIYPPLLADKGLGEALEAQARKATVPVRVDADGIGRYPQEVEAAVYFCCLEALQNAQKYAAASQAVVTLRAVNGALTFQVADNGKGFDAATVARGAGLTNMADRVDALGGSLEVHSTKGGTRVEASIPVAA